MMDKHSFLSRKNDSDPIEWEIIISHSIDYRLIFTHFVLEKTMSDNETKISPNDAREAGITSAGRNQILFIWRTQSQNLVFL